MADRLYLSLWLKNPSPLTFKKRFLKVVETFPFSKLGPNMVLTVRAVSNQEAALMEDSFAGATLLDQMNDALEAWNALDTSFELEAAWDLLLPTEAEWKLQPSKILLIGYAQDFEREHGEDLRIEFGNENIFLPSPESPASFRYVEDNIKSLLYLVKQLETALPIQKRLLWSESGSNFAERLAMLTQNPDQPIQ